MRLPIIKKLVESNFDTDYLEETIEVLDSICDARGIKDEELDVLGEMISNIEGAKVVLEDIQYNNTPHKEALNAFMKRVLSAVN
tara:strand:- start:946 stop:1197 length:252 start_codon:yes stop_codon:yes gene_type:complete